MMWQSCAGGDLTGGLWCGSGKQYADPAAALVRTGCVCPGTEEDAQRDTGPQRQGPSGTPALGEPRRRYVSSAAAGSYSTSTGRWSEAERDCGVSTTRCVRSAGTSALVTRTASMRRRTPCAP